MGSWEERRETSEERGGARGASVWAVEVGTKLRSWILNVVAKEAANCRGVRPGLGGLADDPTARQHHQRPPALSTSRTRLCALRERSAVGLSIRFEIVQLFIEALLYTRAFS